MKRVYVVEDEAIVALELMDQLRSLGFDACGHASRAEVALRELPHVRPDLILMDVNLGRGPSGIDVAEALGDSLDVPIIFVTAYTDADVAGRAALTSSFGFIAKPFQTHVLRANIEMALALHDSRRLVRSARAALELSQKEYEALVAAAPVGVFRADPGGACVFVNATWCAIAGYSAQAAMGAGWTEAIHPEDRADVVAQWRASAREVRPFRREYRIRGPAGRVSWVLGQSSPLLGDDGRVLAHVGTVTDITELREAEAAVRESERRFRVLFEQAAVGAAEVETATGAVLRVNRRFLQLVQRTEAELARGLAPCLHPDDRAADADALTRLAGGDSREYAAERRFVRPDGEVVWAEVSASSLAPAGLPSERHVVVALDVTARKAAEARFRDLFEFSPDAVLLVDEHGRIDMANRRASELFGYTHDELVGLGVEQLMPAAARGDHVELRRRFLDAPLPRLMGGGRTALKALRKDGVVLDVDISLSPMDTPRGRVVVTAVRDVGARLKAEAEREALAAQLRAAQKMEALGTLAGGIAHDFNNVLAIVFGNLELARTGVLPGSAQHEALESIQIAAGRARDLVRQILTFSQRHERPREIVALPVIVEETVRLLRASLPAFVELRTSLGTDVPKVAADPTQLHQILTNLCTNAWHAIDGRPGRISIGLSSVVLDGPALRALSTPDLAPGTYACLTVADDGSGMDASVRARVFEPFFTTKPTGRGTGLGLSVVHGIVRNHGGAISVESRVGEGSVFRIYLPAARDTAVDSGPRHASAAPRGDGVRVLFLDDEPMIALFADRILGSLGYEVTTFTDAGSALAAFATAPHAFELVVTDLNMPECSGLDVVRALRRLREDLPIVVASGHLDNAAHEAIVALGGCVILEKPWTSTELASALALVRPTARP